MQSTGSGVTDPEDHHLMMESLENGRDVRGAAVVVEMAARTDPAARRAVRRVNNLMITGEPALEPMLSCIPHFSLNQLEIRSLEMTELLDELCAVDARVLLLTRCYLLARVEGVNCGIGAVAAEECPRLAGIVVAGPLGDAPRVGRVDVRSCSPASIHLDGVPVGTIAKRGSLILVASPGTHTVTVRHPDGTQKEHPIEVIFGAVIRVDPEYPGVSLALDMEDEMRDTVYDSGAEITAAGTALNLSIFGRDEHGKNLTLFALDWENFGSSDLSDAVLDAWSDAPYGSPPGASPGQKLRATVNTEALHSCCHLAALENGGEQLWNGAATASVVDVRIRDQYVFIAIDGETVYHERIVGGHHEGDWENSPEYAEYLEGEIDQVIARSAGEMAEDEEPPEAPVPTGSNDSDEDGLEIPF